MGAGAGTAHADCVGGLCVATSCTGTVNVCPSSDYCRGTIDVCPGADPDQCDGSVDICLGLVVNGTPCDPLLQPVCDVIWPPR